MNKLFAVLLVLCLFTVSGYAQATDPADEFKATGFNQKALYRVINDLRESSGGR